MKDVLQDGSINNYVLKSILGEPLGSYLILRAQNGITYAISHDTKTPIYDQCKR